MPNPYIKTSIRLADATYNGLPVKVRLLTSKEKKEFVKSFAEAGKTEDDMKASELLSPMILTPDGKPAFSAQEFFEEMADTETTEILNFFMSFNGMKKAEETLKNSETTRKS